MLKRASRAMAVAVPLVLLFVLAVQNRSLRADRTLLIRRSLEPHRGLYVPTFAASAIQGGRLTVGEGAPGSCQVLLIFTTTCPYCRASIPAWKSLLTAFEKSSVPVEVIGIALDSLPAIVAYVDEHQLPFPVVQFPDRKTSMLYRARNVPRIMILDESGRVVYTRLGTLETNAQIDSVVAAAVESAAEAPTATGEMVGGSGPQD